MSATCATARGEPGASAPGCDGADDFRLASTLRPLAVRALAVLICVALALARPLPAQTQERLVPANFTETSDSQGFRWDIGPAGHVVDGTNDCFDNAEALSVNGNDFQPQQAMMTADGREYVFTGMFINLRVTRRVKVDPKSAAVRYVEILHNPTSSPVQATLALNTQFGSNRAQTVITDSGANVPTQYGGGASVPFSLGSKDTGVVACMPPGAGQPSVVFHLAGPRSKLLPSVFSDQHFRFTIGYTVTVPPRKSVAILHGLAQRRLPGTVDAKTATALLKPFNERGWIRDLPGEVQRAIQNRGGSAGGYEDIASLASLESLGVAPGPSDVLAVGRQTRLAGAASGKSVAVETRYGAVEVPFDRVAALEGKRHALGRPRVFLRDGQVFGGTLKLTGVTFTMNTGLSMALSAEGLDRLVMHAAAGDDKEAEKPPADVVAMLETVDGDRLALVRAAGRPLAISTPWGDRELPMEHVSRLFAVPGYPGHRVVLRDGSRLFAFLDNRPIAVKTAAFGPQEFPATSVHSVIAVDPKTEGQPEPAELLAPHLVLAGNNLLVGQVDLPAVHFVAGGQAIPVPPGQIRALRNLSEDAPVRDGPDFEAELWDGGIITGKLQEIALPVRTADRVVDVLPHDVIEARVPTPSVADTVRTKIAELIRDLGHPEYVRRMAASEALGKMGYLPKLQLEEALRQSADPEVKRSVQSLLEQMKE